MEVRRERSLGPVGRSRMRAPTRNGAVGLLVAATLLCGQTGRADDWPFFRGPNHDGTSREKGWVTDWGADGPTIAWRADVGVGAASFAVVGERVLTTGNRAGKDVVSCLNAADGKVLWQEDFPCKFEKRMFEGGTASTPTVDGGLVYNLSYDGQVRCRKLADGSMVWNKHVIRDFGGALSRWKYACSPLIEGDLLILDIGGEGNSTLALSKKTGAKVWGAGSDQAGYATPIAVNIGGTRALMVFKGKAFLGLDAKDGREIWRVPWKTAYDVNASTPIVAGSGRVFVSSGYGGGRGVLFDLAGGTPTQLWRNDQIKTKTSTCVVHDGHVFGVSEKGGLLMCIDMVDGQTIWSEKGFGVGTLTLADGRLIVLGEWGELVIAPATSDGFMATSRAQVLKGRCWVNPVLANGRIYCRTNKGQVACVDARK